jgi:hypothetical protein
LEIGKVVNKRFCQQRFRQHFYANKHFRSHR